MKRLSKTIKKWILTILIIIVIVLAACLLQYAVYYYSNPYKEEMNFSSTGCLILTPDGKDIKTVPVEIKGEYLHYIFGNNEDAIQGDITVNGYSIFGHGRNYDGEGLGFYSVFYESDYTCVSINDDNRLCKVIVIPALKISARF